MKSKMIICAAALAAATPAIAQDVDNTTVVVNDEVDPGNLEIAREIMEAMFPAAEQDEMLMSMMANIADQYKKGALQAPIFEDPGIRDIMNEFLADLPETLRPLVEAHFPKMKEATAIAYARQFSRRELEDISDFAKTPSGATYFRHMTDVLSDPEVAAANAEYFQGIAALQAEQAQVMQNKVQDYLMENPEVLERLEEKFSDPTN